MANFSNSLGHRKYFLRLILSIGFQSWEALRGTLHQGNFDFFILTPLQRHWIPVLGSLNGYPELGQFGLFYFDPSSEHCSVEPCCTGKHYIRIHNFSYSSSVWFSYHFKILYDINLTTLLKLNTYKVTNKTKIAKCVKACSNHLSSVKSHSFVRNDI